MKIVKYIKSEYKYILLLSIGFAAAYFLPVGHTKFNNAVIESFALVKWYAREHVILCLIPAFYIAGAIGAFVSSKSVMKYLGANANKFLAYSVASVSGAILTVCSCTVLPIFGGIWKMGAGLGPAIAFLYSGPAINVLAIILTARVLGIELGLARTIGAILFGVVIGLIMHLIYRKEEQIKAEAQMQIDEPEVNRPLWQVAIYFAVMIAILIFANWGESPDTESFWYLVWKYKWRITAVSGLIFCYILIKWIKLKPLPVIILGAVTSIIALLFPNNPSVAFLVGSLGLGCILISSDGEAREWGETSYNFAKQIFPLLFIGVLVTGFLFGRPGSEGIIPERIVQNLVGGDSLFSNFFSSIFGAFMYFATLTEVPILQGLIGSGMGKGPALALLLAGPALSLPNMIVLQKLMGGGKTFLYVTLVVIFATMTGFIYGKIF